MDKWIEENELELQADFFWHDPQITRSHLECYMSTMLDRKDITNVYDIYHYFAKANPIMFREYCSVRWDFAQQVMGKDGSC